MQIISEATKSLLYMSDKPGVGPAALRRVIEQEMSSSIQSEVLLENTYRTDVSLNEKNEVKKLRATQTLEKCHELDIKILSPFDPEYPSLLGSIKDYPPLLYVKGDTKHFSALTCAVVGTREASRVGLSWAKQIAEIFVSHQFVVISGLALGIDTAAHEGALKGAGITIAILAHGLDQVTPGSNRKLAERILEADGALISEHPPGVLPYKQEYVRRNRLQSGMSICSVVVESGETGGAIHQARFTREQGRVLFTVLPNSNLIETEKFNEGGAKFLIRELGALVLHERKDLIQHLNSSFFQDKRRDLLHLSSFKKRLS